MHNEEKPYRLHKFTPPPGFPASNVEFDVHDDNTLIDLRNAGVLHDLERDSFKFVHQPSHVLLDGSLDAVKAYCQESIDILKGEISSERVICYEVLVRCPQAQGFFFDRILLITFVVPALASKGFTNFLQEFFTYQYGAYWQVKLAVALNLISDND